jgi:hypothetical protein
VWAGEGGRALAALDRLAEVDWPIFRGQAGLPLARRGATTEGVGSPGHQPAFLHAMGGHHQCHTCHHSISSMGALHLNFEGSMKQATSPALSRSSTIMLKGLPLNKRTAHRPKNRYSVQYCISNMLRDPSPYHQPPGPIPYQICHPPNTRQHHDANQWRSRSSTQPPSLQPSEICPSFR